MKKTVALKTHTSINGSVHSSVWMCTNYRYSTLLRPPLLTLCNTPKTFGSQHPYPTLFPSPHLPNRASPTSPSPRCSPRSSPCLLPLLFPAVAQYLPNRAVQMLVLPALHVHDLHVVDEQGEVLHLQRQTLTTRLDRHRVPILLAVVVRHQPVLVVVLRLRLQVWEGVELCY